MTTVSECPFLCLDPSDNVAMAKQVVPEGTSFALEAGGQPLETRQRIEMGHKVATRPIRSGEMVRKFGQPIGFATQDIARGDWVHLHNLEPGEFSRDCTFASDIPPDPKPITGRTFLGYRRSDGRAATRNYVAVISTSNCSATAAKRIARQVEESVLADYPNIDGIIGLTHSLGCAMQYDGEEHRLLSRTLAGYVRHPNVAACLVVGLGCETAQGAYLEDQFGLVQLDIPGRAAAPLPLVINIHDEGGFAKTVRRGVAILKELLPEANRVERVEIPVSELILATECGGSDAHSGITANPAAGIASDLMVAHGGTAVVGEVPEICGGEHLLTRRAKTVEIGKALVERIDWWQDYAKKLGGFIDNNPSVGNKQGGLTTIYEKSLGAVAKAGSTALRAVYRYAEPVTEKGLVIMDTPGYDPYSVTGLVAGGAHVVVFTTGRGSCFGCKPVPTIKVATNTPMFDRMADDMDINAGRILEGMSVEDVGRELFEQVILVASGKQTKSELQGIGEEEFCPWSIGPVL